MGTSTKRAVRIRPAKTRMIGEAEILGNFIELTNSGSMRRIIESPGTGFTVIEPRFTARVKRMMYTSERGTYRMYHVDDFDAGNISIRKAEEIVMAGVPLCKRWEIAQYLVVKGGRVCVPGMEVKVVPGLYAHVIIEKGGLIHTIHARNPGMDFRLIRS